MKTHVCRTAQLGELVVAAFGEAARYSTNSREVSRLGSYLRRQSMLAPDVPSLPCSRDQTRDRRRPLDPVGCSSAARPAQISL
jgi:hypothetical protein